MCCISMWYTSRRTAHGLCRVALFFHDAPPYVPIGDHGKLVGSGVGLFAPLLFSPPR